MKKIPTLFKRTYDGPRIKGITDEVAPGLEWVLAGEGPVGLRLQVARQDPAGRVLTRFWRGKAK